MLDPKFDPDRVERKTVPWFRGDDEGISAVPAEDYDQLLEHYRHAMSALKKELIAGVAHREYQSPIFD